MKDGNDYKEWDTIKSVCGKARLTYHANWDQSRPWVTYRDGTAGRHFTSLLAGIQYLKAFGYTFDNPIKLVGDTNG